MSYLSQMAGLAWHNFISAAAGIARRRGAGARPHARAARASGPGTIGNFWVDLTRATVYVLLPICVVFALVFVSQGMIQNLAPYHEVTTLEGGEADHRHGPGGLAGGHQAARHQRRRLLQRQRRAPVREPQPADQLPLDVPDLRHPGRPDLHLRPHGAATSARAGRCSRAMAFLFLAGVGVAYWAEAGGNPIDRTRLRRRSRASATWRARRSASASPTRRCTPP